MLSYFLVFIYHYMKISYNLKMHQFRDNYDKLKINILRLYHPHFLFEIIMRF